MRFSLATQSWSERSEGGRARAKKKKSFGFMGLCMNERAMVVLAVFRIENDSCLLSPKLKLSRLEFSVRVIRRDDFATLDLRAIYINRFDFSSHCELRFVVRYIFAHGEGSQINPEQSVCARVGGNGDFGDDQRPRDESDGGRLRRIQTHAAGDLRGRLEKRRSALRSPSARREGKNGSRW